MYLGILGQYLVIGVAKGVWGGVKLLYSLATYDEASRAGELREAAEKLQHRNDACETVERLRTELRDADIQYKSYKFEVGAHANEALAYRYGIANMAPHTNDRGQTKIAPSRFINLQKTRKIKDGQYKAVLSNFGGREVVAVIEPGTEYVKTFLPLNDDWFEKFAALETALKGGQTFTLKELARMHVEFTVPRI